MLRTLYHRTVCFFNIILCMMNFSVLKFSITGLSFICIIFGQYKNIFLTFEDWTLQKYSLALQCTSQGKRQPVNPLNFVTQQNTVSVCMRSHFPYLHHNSFLDTWSPLPWTANWLTCVGRWSQQNMCFMLFTRLPYSKLPHFAQHPWYTYYQQPK